MNETPNSVFAMGFAAGILSGLMLASAMCWAINADWQHDCIKHGAARYNATTGVFEWIEKAEVGE